ncbi:tetratricopeptide repeat protein [Clostridium perfringens]|uniref:tetratricopeptide repeat protein n=1 Tax=Clostridium perfringens TaxID=1502 RepID=UPI003D32EE02
MGIFNFFKSKNKATKSEINSAWQKIICGNTENSITKEDLLKLSNLYIEDRIRIIMDCVNLINSTTSIDVYFNRYNLLTEKLNELSLLEPFIPFKAPAPSIQLQQILLEKDLKTKEMLQRAWNNTKLKILDLKTDKAKLKNIDSFFESSYSHISSLGTESTKFLAELKKDSENLLLKLEKDVTSNIEFDEFKEKNLLLQLNNCDNAYDRHFAYMELQNFYYKYRNLDMSYLNKCIEYCLLDINSLKALNDDYIKHQINMEVDVMKYIYTEKEIKERIDKIASVGFDASIPAFKRLAIIYEKQKEYEKAIEICEKAIEYGEESDGTKEGFKGRIKKLKSKKK